MTWLDEDGREPLGSIRRRFRRAIRKVCPAPAPGWRYPDFHSLRRTCASALARIAPKVVVRFVLGHGPEDVTGVYIAVTLEDQLAALNRAALLIDGDAGENVIPLVPLKIAMASER